MTIVSVTGTMSFMGLVYVLLVEEFNLHSILQGLESGAIIGLIVAPAELFLFNKVRRRLRFIPFLVLRSAFYVTVIGSVVFSVTLHHLTEMEPIDYAAAFQKEEFQRFLWGGEFATIIAYALAVSIAVNLFRDMNRFLGPRFLLNHVSGKYHSPAEEERVFLFLDLNSSTTIAERLGHLRYHRFLNDFFFDITPAILESRGEIYQYVGDEVVVTWTKRNGLSNANCLACFFRIAAIIHRESDKYHRRYGVSPTFKAGCHIGPVITAEVGDLKREVAFHGDTVNTAARIRSECSPAGRSLLLSGELLRQLDVSEYLTPVPVGALRLKGKDQQVDLYAISEAG